MRVSANEHLDTFGSVAVTRIGEGDALSKRSGGVADGVRRCPLDSLGLLSRSEAAALTRVINGSEIRGDIAEDIVRRGKCYCARTRKIFVIG